MSVGQAVKELRSFLKSPDDIQAFLGRHGSNGLEDQLYAVEELIENLTAFKKEIQKDWKRRNLRVDPKQNCYFAYLRG